MSAPPLDKPPRGGRRRVAPLLAGLLIAAMVLAGAVSFYASSQPDGLERVAQDHGFASLEQPHDADDSAFAGYSTRGVHDQRLSGALAGLLGVGLTFLISGGVFLAVRRRSHG